MNEINIPSKILTFNDAISQIQQSVHPLTQTENTRLPHATGRILAKSIISPINVPAFSNSAMDGYAVRLTDLDNCSILPVSGCILAGNNAQKIPWPQGTCLRIMTGAPIPDDADAVVMQEKVTVTDEGIRFATRPTKHDNIRLKGEDIQAGSEVLTAGTKLSIPMLALIASLGLPEVTVYKRPIVAIFSTGDELTELGQPLTNGHIYDSNRVTLSLMLAQLGCEIIDLGLILDNPDAVRNAFLEADKRADVVISSGGVSVGDADYTQQILNEIGNVSFWKLAIKPGKPFAFGKLEHAWFCGLPGNPVSAIVTFYQLVQPLLIKLSGDRRRDFQHPFKVKTCSPLKKTPGRMDFQRGILRLNVNGEWEVESTGHQGSHMLHSLYQANCFILLEQERGYIAAGEWVTVAPFNAVLGE